MMRSNLMSSFSCLSGIRLASTIMLIPAPATMPSSLTLTLLCTVLLSTLASTSAWHLDSQYRHRNGYGYAAPCSSSCRSFTSFRAQSHQQRNRIIWAVPESEDETETTPTRNISYDLGVGKNDDDDEEIQTRFWMAPDTVDKHQDDADADATNGVIDADQVDGKRMSSSTADSMMMTNRQQSEIVPRSPKTTRRMVARDNDSQLLRGALWDEMHYEPETETAYGNRMEDAADGGRPHSPASSNCPPRPSRFYPDIDMSIPESVYSEDDSVDLVWDLLRWDAYQEAQREPLLVSFLYSTILNHRSLESSLAFLLANRLQSPGMMISTQLQSIILDSLSCPVFRRSLRADMMAVRDRDPACNCLPDVFLYFKGFHALQSHRVAHCLWNSGKFVLAHFMQSQVSQVFQIDIHPNATMGRYVTFFKFIVLADGACCFYAGMRLFILCFSHYCKRVSSSQSSQRHHARSRYRDCDWRDGDDWTQLQYLTSRYPRWIWQERSRSTSKCREWCVARRRCNRFRPCTDW
jgi:hypothetical protein